MYSLLILHMILRSNKSYIYIYIYININEVDSLIYIVCATTHV